MTDTRRRTSCILLAIAQLAAAAAGFSQLADVGLSTVRSEWNPNLGFPPHLFHPNSYYGEALAVGDFDGDGSDDLAIGVPGDDGPEGDEVDAGGAVMVRFGAPGAGLEPAPTLFLTQAPPLAIREPGDAHGSSLAACDFNGDGADDLAIGAPNEDWTSSSVGGSGAVYVHYGHATSPLSGIDLVLTQETGFVPGDSEPGDGFGERLACGDFDGDGFADLVIGSPREDLGAAENTGMIYVVPGSATGLAPDNQAFDQNSVGIDGIAEATDRFGDALAAGDFDGDGFDELAIGVPGEANATHEDTGIVHVLRGSVNGLTSVGDLLLSDATFGGAEEAYERFGWTLASGDFDDDGFADLLIGTPYEGIGSDHACGVVIEVQGSAGGLDLAGAETWDENRISSTTNANETNDNLGIAFAVGDFDGDGTDDVAIGQSGESVFTESEGAVTAVRGRAGTGLDPLPNRARRFIAGNAGLAGPPGDFYRKFGTVLVAGDFDGDGQADLAAGVRAEHLGTTSFAGSVVTLRGALFADGLELGTTGFWTAVEP